MKVLKWEYIQCGNTQNDQSLNKLGQQGWELVSSYRSNQNIIYHVLKRPCGEINIDFNDDSENN